MRSNLGTLATRSGYVDMRIGVSQLVIVDGANGYTLDLETDTFARITSPGWLGSTRVGYVDGYFLFADPATGVWYISAIEDASSLDPLDFATASSAPDDLVAVVNDHGQAWLFGATTTEVWDNTGAADFPFEKNRGATMQTGCLGAFTIQPLDNTLFWLGRDTSGAGMVFRAQGYQPQRVSNTAVEQAIQAAIERGENMAQAVAHTYQQHGRSFYVLNVPGLNTTWAYDVTSGQWHERAEFVNGDYAQHRGKFHAYAYGRHIIGGDDGALYVYDTEANTNAGDTLVRDRISPHYATPQLSRIKFGAFELDCTVGRGKEAGAEAHVMLRTSDDGGESWGSWRTQTMGGIGQTRARARFLRNGSAHDRVWHVRCTDDVPFSIVGAAVAGSL